MSELQIRNSQEYTKATEEIQAFMDGLPKADNGDPVYVYNQWGREYRERVWIKETYVEIAGVPVLAIEIKYWEGIVKAINLQLQDGQISRR